MSQPYPECLQILNVRLLDENGSPGSATSLLIKGGRITAVGKEAEQAREADQAKDTKLIEANGALALPGLVDLYCNLREPGDGQKGSLRTETLAAARGGFTTVCASPESSPVNDSGAVTHLIRETAQAHSPIEVLPLGAATRGLQGELLSDMAGLSAAGCVALSNGSRTLVDARVLRRAMAYARTFGFTLMLQPRNRALAADGFAHDGLVATRLGMIGVPEVAETAAVMEMLLLAEETGVHLHLSQLSCARSVSMLAEARERGVSVTADVAMHQLCLTDEALASFDSRFHLQPPLRSEKDRQGLVAGIESGVIDAIVSQHLPNEQAAKRAPFSATETGLSTVESVLSLGLMLVERKELGLGALVRALTAGPASVLGREAGAVRVGSPANLCLVDTEARWTPAAETLLSEGRHAPVMCQPVPGQVVATVARGALAWSRDNFSG